jgi:hypothetical protein
MIGWLLKNLIQEVPEELSVCEFDCPNNKCTVRDWGACELRHQLALYGSGIGHNTSRMVPVEVPAFALSGFVKSRS